MTTNLLVVPLFSMLVAKLKHSESINNLLVVKRVFMCLKKKKKKASLPLCGELNSPRLLFKATFQTNQHHSIVTVS